MTLDCIKSSTDDPIQPQTQLDQYDDNHSQWIPHFPYIYLIKKKTQKAIVKYNYIVENLTWCW